MGAIIRAASFCTVLVTDFAFPYKSFSQHYHMKRETGISRSAYRNPAIGSVMLKRLETHEN